MWYEILPSLSIVTGALILPGIFVGLSNYIVLGQKTKRVINDRSDVHFYMRDQLVTKRQNPYDFCGLECIPDPPQPVVREPEPEEEVVCYIRKKKRP